MLLPVGLSATISIGPVSSGGASTSHEYRDDYGAWFIADLETDPVTPAPHLITISGSAGAWTQTLTFASGAPNLNTGDLFIVQQLLEVSGGGFSISNWEQQILTPGWQWSESIIFDNDTANPLTGLLTNLSPSQLSSTFAPLADGQQIFIVQVLEYVGPDDAAPAPVTLKASVVPEPGAASLGMLGAAVLILRKRRLQGVLQEQFQLPISR